MGPGGRGNMGVVCGKAVDWGGDILLDIDYGGSSESTGFSVWE